MRDGTALSVKSVNLETVECYSCGVLFAIPHNLRRRYVNTGDTFYCPNGHGQSYSESTESRLQRELDAQKRRTEFEKNRRVAAEQEAERQSHIARGQKAAKTRLKNRISKGVCPCCNRTFQNLAQHMKNKHPSFTPESDD